VTLTDVYNEFYGKPMLYGLTDCMQLCARAWFAQTGTNFAAQFPNYRTEEEARKMIDGAGGMAAFIESLLGASKPGNQAKRGDVVLLNIGDISSGVCLGDTAITMSPRGIMSITRHRFLACWSPA